MNKAYPLGIFILLGNIFFCCCTMPIENQIESKPASSDESCEIVKAVTTNYDNKDNVERTVKCTCKTGKVAGTTREKPACVSEEIFKTSKWCEMDPCLLNEICNEKSDGSGWTCDNGITTKHVKIENDRHPVAQVATTDSATIN